jgi:DnaK suppressor protein
MNTDKLNAARQRLATEYEALARSIRRSRLAAEEIQVENTEDEADLATINQTRDLNYNLQESDFARLKSIEIALESLERGEYGECSRCGNDIKEKRLEVVPWATMCIHCQEKAEGEASSKVMARQEESSRSW